MILIQDAYVMFILKCWFEVRMYVWWHGGVLIITKH